MPYALQRLAEGSYDLLLDDALVGGVAWLCSSCGMIEGWLAELLDETNPLPAPFHQATHEFRTLGSMTLWLGMASVEAAA